MEGCARYSIYVSLFLFMLCMMWQVSKWQWIHMEAERILASSGIGTEQRRTAYPLLKKASVCTCPHLQANSSVALVSALTKGPEMFLYIQSLEKLYRTTRQFTSMDTVLLTWLTDVTVEGWTTCSVPPIEGPLILQSNRLFQAHVYSKLRVWGLTQYDSVLYVDSDTLHYTCKPWHAWNCWWDDIEDLCLVWYM